MQEKSERTEVKTLVRLGSMMSNELGLHLSSSGWPADKPQSVSSFLYDGFVFVSVSVFLFRVSQQMSKRSAVVYFPLKHG